MNWLQTVRGVIGAITDLGLALLALVIVLFLLVGDIGRYTDVVGRLVDVVNRLVDGGLAGLIAIGIIIWLFAKRSPS